MQNGIRYNEAHLHHAAAVLDEAVRSDAYPNAVVAIGNNEKLLWSHVASGNDDVIFDTIFPLASVTKPILGLAVMQLVERGLLLLSDPVSNFIPEFAQNGKESVIVWHLLTHTSGLVEDEPALGALFERRAPASDYLALAITTDLAFEPGYQCRYCNLAFLVLAEMITRLTGQPYPDYLRDQIFSPLGMNDTAFSPTDPTRAAPAYNFGEPADVAYWNSLAAPHGGLWSTASDLLILGRALLNDGRAGDYQLLSPAALEAMTSLQTAGLYSMVEGRSQPSFAALTWGKSSGRGVILGSNRAYGHGGSTGTYFHIDPEWNLAYVCLSSRWNNSHDPAIRALNAVYGALQRETAAR